MQVSSTGVLLLASSRRNMLPDIPPPPACPMTYPRVSERQEGLHCSVSRLIAGLQFTK